MNTKDIISTSNKSYVLTKKDDNMNIKDIITINKKEDDFKKKNQDDIMTNNKYEEKKCLFTYDMNTYSWIFTG